MLRPWLSFLTTVVALVALLLPRAAHADEAGAHTVPITVLALDTDDADENADALTGALRSQIRAAEGWSLKETTQSLSLLTAALKCSSHPNADCQEKIADQIKSDRYVWGFVTKGPSAGQVTAEIHLYQRNKPDTTSRASFASNLKDANDDALREIAKRIVGELGGKARGVVVVHAGEANGEVIVDGDKRVPLTDGEARIELAEGSHSIEVDAPTIARAKRTVLVTSGKETTVDVAAMTQIAPPTAPSASSKAPTRKIVGGIVLGAGVILGAVAIQQGLLYMDLQDRGDVVRDRLSKQPAMAGKKPCEPNGDQEFCTINNRSVTASALAITTGALAVVGVGIGSYLLLTDGGSEDSSSTAKSHKPRIAPMLSTTTGGLMMSGTF